MPTTPGLNTDSVWGPLRTSAVATSAGGQAVFNMVDVPPTLADTFTHQEPDGLSVQDVTLNITRQDLKLTFATAWAAKTAYPWARFIRGTAGGLCELAEDVRLAAIPDNQAVGEWNASDYTLAVGPDGGWEIFAGVLFDHTMAHAAGVSAPVTGSILQLGAVSATQSIKVLFVNPHSPTPTWSGAVMQLESDPVIGFTTATLRGAAVTGIGSSASYSFQTIPGPVTDEYWRANIPTVPSGLGYPVVLAWIVDN